MSDDLAMDALCTCMHERWQHDDPADIKGAICRAMAPDCDCVSFDVMRFQSGRVVTTSELEALANANEAERR
jgi:hypothetical protein